ncbi:hypothetical protein [Paenibacillus cymbidii]|uniref:hypothetical protein n=1 Tax=Paenibacillus cymbidii TaxID=1639034 RepID=UPI001080EB44|nr:hypothetical protein [Paenibacillus cymbidii]
MNLLDAYVTEVLGTEEADCGYGPTVVVHVKYECWGSVSERPLLFTGDDRHEAAAKVQKGYHFLT